MNQNKQTHQKITQELQIEEPKNFLIFNDVISSITVDEEFLYITSNENKALLTSLNDFQKESSKTFSIQTNSIISHLRKRQEEGEGLIMTSQGEGNVLVIDPETKKQQKYLLETSCQQGLQLITKIEFIPFRLQGMFSVGISKQQM